MRVFTVLTIRHFPDLGSASVSLKQISRAARPIKFTARSGWSIVIRHEYGIFVLAPQPSFVRIMLMLASRNVACFPRPGLQISPYFWSFKYARTVKQKVWSWEVTLKIRSGACEARLRLLRYSYATPNRFWEGKNSNNNKTTVLQSTSGQEPGGSHALFLRNKYSWISKYLVILVENSSTLFIRLTALGAY